MLTKARPLPSLGEVFGSFVAGLQCNCAQSHPLGLRAVFGSNFGDVCILQDRYMDLKGISSTRESSHDTMKTCF